MPPSTANEVLILFSQALSSPAESEQQANILTEVKQAIEAEPSFLPVLYSTILSVAGRAGPLLKRWIADIVEFTVARLAVLPSPISQEQRAHRGLIFSFRLKGCSCRVYMRLCVSVCVLVLCCLGYTGGSVHYATWRKKGGRRYMKKLHKVSRLAYTYTRTSKQHAALDTIYYCTLCRSD